MTHKPSFASVTAALSTLTDEELSAIAEKPKSLKEFASKLVADIVASTFVVHMDDNDVPERYRETVAKWRAYAASLGYTGPVAWTVKEGFTLKKHAPLAGPCYSNLDFLHDWDIKDDESTQNSLVFWVPRLAPDSTWKTAEQMATHRDALKQRCGLPTHHATKFGSIALHFALILAHFKRTGERVPLNFYYAASDAFHADGRRLVSGGFRGGGLGCSVWGGRARGAVGFFLLGVEELGI